MIISVLLKAMKVFIMSRREALLLIGKVYAPVLDEGKSCRVLLAVTAQALAQKGRITHLRDRNVRR